MIHGERAWKAAREYVVPALEKAGLTITTEWLYGHDATHENADKISNDPAVQEADMLLAVGGGNVSIQQNWLQIILENRYLPLLPLRLTALLLPRSVLCTMRMVLSATSQD